MGRVSAEGDNEGKYMLCAGMCVCVCVCTRTDLHLAYVCASICEQTREEVTATVYRQWVVCIAVNHVCWLFGVCYWKAIVYYSFSTRSVSYNGSKGGRAGYT